MATQATTSLRADELFEQHRTLYVGAIMAYAHFGPAGQPQTIVAIGSDEWVRPCIADGHLNAPDSFRAWLGDTDLSEYRDDESIMRVAQILYLRPEAPDEKVIDQMAQNVMEDFQAEYDPPYDVDFDDYAESYETWWEDYRDAGGEGVFTEEEISGAVEAVFENKYRPELTDDDEEDC